MTDSYTFKNLHLKNTQHWNDELLRSTNTRKLIDGTEPLGIKPGIYNAPPFVLDKMVGRGWLAIGDAASSYDPVTSQGILKSMRDGMTAAPCVANYMQKKEFGVLEQYQSIVTAHHHQYRQMRDYLYMQESRFKEQSFWRKMHNLRSLPQHNSMAI